MYMLACVCATGLGLANRIQTETKHQTWACFCTRTEASEARVLQRLDKSYVNTGQSYYSKSTVRKTQ